MRFGSWRRSADCALSGRWVVGRARVDSQRWEESEADETDDAGENGFAADQTPRAEADSVNEDPERRANPKIHTSIEAFSWAEYFYLLRKQWSVAAQDDEELDGPGVFAGVVSEVQIDQEGRGDVLSLETKFMKTPLKLVETLAISRCLPMRCSSPNSSECTSSQTRRLWLQSKADRIWK